MSTNTFIKSRRWLPRMVALAGAVMLSGLLVAVSAGSRTGAFAAAGGDSTDGNITRVTAELLENSQFSRERLDDELAAKFLDRYVNSLDPAHELFRQSDIRDFNAFRPRLAAMTRREGNLAPERMVFERYLDRLSERTAYVTNFLVNGQFDFTGKDTFLVDRSKAPRPVDFAASRELWRESVRAQYLEEKLAGKKANDIGATLALRYERQLQSMRKLSQEDVLDIYLNALAHVYDPHSDYFGREQMDDFSIAMNLSLFGIGATLQAEDGYCKIVELVPGGPAARSGLLKPGDRIVAVGQGTDKPVDIVNMPLVDAVKLVRGPKGTPVHLAFIPAGGNDSSPRKSLTLVRDEVKLADQQAKASIVDWPQTNGPALRLGVIDLPAFYGDFDRTAPNANSATADVAKLIGKLEAEHVQGLVLDLRQNGGGSLEEAIKLTGLFIHDGPVVQTREADGRTEVDADTDPAELYDGPLVVLTSRFSASASEIMAGALQDYGRALIVGDESTYGKGTVQTVIPLAKLMDKYRIDHSFDPGALKVTIRKFYRPSGASTQLKGVSADIVIPSLSGVTKVGEAVMTDPLPWDRVAPADFMREDQVTPYLGELRAKSAARVAADQDFAVLREEVTQLQKSLAAQTVSLNEMERRRENEAAQAREASWKHRLAEVPESQLKIINVTVQEAGAAALPAAVSDAKGSPKASAGDPQHDPVLREAEHIIADYVSLSQMLPPASVAVAP